MMRALGNQRHRGVDLAGGVVAELDLPLDLAGGVVERNDMGIERRQVDLVLVHRDTAIDRFAAQARPEIAGQRALVFPDDATGGTVHRKDLVLARRDVDAAIDDGSLTVLRVIHAEGHVPLRHQLPDVVAVDLRQLR